MLNISEKQMSVLGGWNLSLRLNAHLLSQTENSEIMAIMTDKGVTELLWAPIFKADTSRTVYEIALRLTFATACFASGRDPQKEILKIELMEDSEIAMKKAWADWGVFRFSVLDV